MSHECDEPLLGVRKLPTPPKSNWKDSVLLKTACFGLNGLFFAAHLALNGKYLASLSSHSELDPSIGAAASSIMSTYQSVIIGSSVGLLLGTGLDFGGFLGKKEYDEAGNVAKTAMILSVILGMASAGAMLLTRVLFPLLFNQGTAAIASQFFTGYATAAIPLLLIVVGSQLAFQCGDWFIPPLSMFLVLSLAGAASYYFGFMHGMGALGIGLGSGLGSAVAATGLLLWFKRNAYQNLSLFSHGIDGFALKLKSLLNLGWKLAFQRLTEWGNLLLINTIVGMHNNNALSALNAGMLYLVLFGTTEQGFAQSVGMIIAKNKGAIQTAIEGGRSEEVEKFHRQNVAAVFRSNLFALLLNTGVAGLFYVYRKTLTAFFLPLNCAKEIAELSQDLLWINMLGLLPDALRIVGAGALRGWKDLLYPTLVSFIFMTALGVPAAIGLNQFVNIDESRMIGYGRDVGMIFAAVCIMYRCVVKLVADEKSLKGYLLRSSLPGIFSSCFSHHSEIQKAGKSLNEGVANA